MRKCLLKLVLPFLQVGFCAKPVSIPESTKSESAKNKSVFVKTEFFLSLFFTMAARAIAACLLASAVQAHCKSFRLPRQQPTR
jgi:hypothetical protein